jgi:hypothetical protein
MDARKKVGPWAGAVEWGPAVAGNKDSVKSV